MPILESVMVYVDRTEILVPHSASDGDPRLKVGNIVLLGRKTALTRRKIDVRFWYGLYTIMTANHSKYEVRTRKLVHPGKSWMY